MQDVTLKNVFIITSADFSMDWKHQRKDIIKSLEQQAYNALGFNISLKDDSVLILWNNFPKEKFVTEVFEYSKEDIIERFCSKLKNLNRTVRLFIKSPLDLGESMAEILEMLLFIWNKSGLVPSILESNFLHNGFINQSFSNLSQDYIKIATAEIQQQSAVLGDLTSVLTEEGLARNFFSSSESVLVEQSLKPYKDYFEKFFNSISNLLELFNIKEEPKHSLYIDLYLDWQIGIKTVEECCKAYGNIERQSWYRYADTLENCPIYEEICNIYLDNLIKYKKKGRVPDTFVLLQELRKKNMSDSAYNIAFIPKEDCYFALSEIHSLIDVTRCTITALDKIKILKHKGLYYAKLEELGITEDLSKYFFTHADVEEMLKKQIEKVKKNNI